MLMVCVLQWKMVLSLWQKVTRPVRRQVEDALQYLQDLDDEVGVTGKARCVPFVCRSVSVCSLLSCLWLTGCKKQGSFLPCPILSVRLYVFLPSLPACLACLALPVLPAHVCLLPCLSCHVCLVYLSACLPVLSCLSCLLVCLPACLSCQLVVSVCLSVSVCLPASLSVFLSCLLVTLSERERERERAMHFSGFDSRACCAGVEFPQGMCWNSTIYTVVQSL